MNRLSWRWRIVLAFAGFIGAALWSMREQSYHPPDDVISIPTGADAIARGKHLVEAVAVCTICHGDDLGGKPAFDDPFLGHGYTANLTGGRGGIGRRYATTDWIRAIRYGVRPDGTGIAFMPSDHYNAISDADLGAVIAFVKSVPAVDNERTSVELNPAARLLIGAGLFGEVNRTALIDLAAPRLPLQRDPGAYLVDVGGCSFCHGPGLAGSQGPEPGAPPAPSLTSNDPVRQWTSTEFIGSIRNGRGFDGHAIDPKYMPWLGYRKMTDPELTFIWRFTGHQH